MKPGSRSTWLPNSAGTWSTQRWSVNSCFSGATIASWRRRSAQKSRNGSEPGPVATNPRLKMPAPMIAASLGSLPSRGSGSRKCGVSTIPCARASSASSGIGANTWMSGSRKITTSASDRSERSR
ncbi:hypothetical protein K7G98_19330 [Saccharothrix sp. MB29]|nr:hypothetical protein [Saccharothrix sp. MB29]